ncbi:10084_t:CDS:10 [Entrophospora sp. SA101]|nr:10084_t:CDS:10 [Entrophospora sp. SA101]
MLLEVIQIIIVTSSFIIILLKFNKQSSDYDFLDESGDTFVGTSRFSTLKRDVFKLVFILLQTGLYTFLFFWDFKNDEESTRLSQDAMFTFYWVLRPKLMHGERPVSGIVYCSIWDFLTFSMISPLINKASKGPLKDSDLEELPFANRALSLYNMDVGRISEFATWWSTGCIDSPIELIVGLYFLYKLLGVSCLLGLLVLLLQGIRMIKFLGWDKKWEARVLDARGEELVQLKKNFIYLSIFDLLWAASPALVSVISFIAYTKIMGNELTVSIAFTSISLFNELRFAFNVIPEFVMELFQCLISVNRIEKFLEEDEIAISNENYTSIENKIAFENATVTWNKNKATKETETNENVAPIFTINDLNIEFPMKELSIICGPTGSGKTLLMMSLLGESNIINGKIFCPRYKMEQTDTGLNSSNWIIENSTAYVAQQAWLQNAAIRDNILFGLPYNESRYKQVIKMCALEKDFRIFEDGDMTEIGEKGITLSGGQKQRCSLARAVYSRAQIIFIDDVLSAVDAHTAKHLMNECILGPLMKGRTRILVTHHVGLCLSGASYLVAINNGKITASSSISDLINTGQLATVLEESDSRAAYDDIIELAAENFDKENANKDSSRIIELSTASSTTTTLINADAGDNNEESIQHNYKPKVLVEEEKRPTGVVRLKIYKTYFRANGFIIFWLIVALLFIFTRVSQVSESVWLKIWSMSSTNDQKMNVTTILPFISLPDSSLIGEKTLHVYEKHSVEYYCGIYVLITFASILIGFARFCWLYFGSLRASRRLYRILLHQIIRAPLRFFDTTPVGRILNRFSKDFETIDDRLISDLAWFLNNVIMMFSTVIVIVSITKELMIASILFGASRDLKRMDSVIRSPLYTHFTETIIGITTIRAFGVTKQFMEEMLFRIDNNNRPFFYVWLINRWLSIRFNIGGAFFIFLVGLFIIISKVDAGLAGLSLSFAMNFTEQIMWSVRKYTSLEMSLNSVERYHEFTEIPQEAPEIIEPRPPASWPHDGAIDVQNLEVRYAPDLEPVLHHISFYIKGCEKVGLVGRTGSGKSTIALSLFRFIEPSDGQILIDGIDISSIGIEDLRSRITIIPQDPILFSDYQDEEIYESLRRVHLLPSSESNQDFTLSGDNINVFKNLDTPINHGKVIEYDR